VKDDQVIVSVSEDSVNVLEEHSSAQELLAVTSTKENKMYNSVNSLTDSEGEKDNVCFNFNFIFFTLGVFYISLSSSYYILVLHLFSVHCKSPFYYFSIYHFTISYFCFSFYFISLPTVRLTLKFWVVKP
jgi:hypothetical protein